MARSYIKSLTHDGVTKTQREWADLYGMPFNRLNHRLRHGWSVKAALMSPRDARGRNAKDEG